MNEILKCNCKLAEVMRGAIPVDGRDFVRMLKVHLEPGQGVSDHNHAEHIALYYPAAAEPIVVTPLAGMIIYLPPGTPHTVPKVKGERVSVAMLVDDR